METSKILAIIPARAGSKSIPNKNIRSLLGKPLIAYSIDHALRSEMVNRIIVSTDSEQYAEIAKFYGAEVPFLRPSEISQDFSTDLEFFIHALEWLKVNEGYEPEICVQLRPTHPVRDPMDIDAMIRQLISFPEADSVRSVVRNKTVTPFKMWYMDENRYLKPLLSLPDISEPYNQPRQILPVTYFQNASIEVIRTSTILSQRTLSGTNILGYLMDEEFDIDYEKDFDRVKSKLSEFATKVDNSPKKYCIDIDGVIASLTSDNDYSKAEPIVENIQKINLLFESGHNITLFTARGSATGIDWSEITRAQLLKWRVKHHLLLFGKPAADFYIDDRNLDISMI